MSRKGEKQVILPFIFKFSDKGKFSEEHCITLRAPSLADFAAHNKMVSYASAAITTAQRNEAVMFSSIGSDVLDKILAARAEMQKEMDKDAEPEPETDEEVAGRVTQMFAAGLGDKFPDFMDFIKKTLTNNARLAAIGDTKVPITDAVWDELNKEGGMEAVNLVLMSFANFFLPAQPSRSQSESGDEKSTTSSRDIPAALN